MNSLNELQLHNRNVIEEIKEINKTENHGSRTPGVHLLGAALSVINRKGLQDNPKKQAKEINKIRQYYKRNGVL